MSDIIMLSWLSKGPKEQEAERAHAAGVRRVTGNYLAWQDTAPKNDYVRRLTGNYLNNK